MGARPDPTARFFAEARRVFAARTVDAIARALVAGARRLSGASHGAVVLSGSPRPDGPRRGRARTRVALRDGRRALGVLELDGPRPRDAARRRALDLLARAGALALANALRAEEDPLTELANRAGALRVLETELGRARRHRRALALVMFDLDRFKALNDRDGHAAGDAALRRIAALLRERSRASDTAARWGGDELVLVLPETPLGGAIAVAEKIRAAAEAAGEPTLSAGVASFPDDGERAETLSEVADARLYRAKAAGRNRVEPEVDSRPRRRR